MTSPLIQVGDVSKKYDVGRPALAGMNPEVNAGEAPVVLADEPTGALDIASAADVRDLLITLNRDGQTIPLVPHDTALAEACATRTIELLGGAIVRLALR
jgi:ABC-type lipoprotein export system ATPase subunit